MNNFVAVLLAGLVAASTATAQTAAPAPTTQQRQQALQGVTQGNPNNDSGQAATSKQQAANVQASKKTAKMTTAEKNKAIKESNKKMINPDNPSGSVAGTAAQQQANTAASKAVPKEKVNLGTPGADKAMEKASTR